MNTSKNIQILKSQNSCTQQLYDSTQLFIPVIILKKAEISLAS